MDRRFVLLSNQTACPAISEVVPRPARLNPFPEYLNCRKPPVLRFRWRVAKQFAALPSQAFRKADYCMLKPVKTIEHLRLFKRSTRFTRGETKLTGSPEPVRMTRKFGTLAGSLISLRMMFDSPPERQEFGSGSLGPRHLVGSVVIAMDQKVLSAPLRLPAGRTPRLGPRVLPSHGDRFSALSHAPHGLRNSRVVGLNGSSEVLQSLMTAAGGLAEQSREIVRGK